MVLYYTSTDTWTNRTTHPYMSLTIHLIREHLVLTWQDLDVLDSMNKALSLLMEFTDALSGD